MIYRGQRYGDPVGEWWTSSRDDALKYAMSRGGNRTYVVLALDEDDERWLARFLMFNRAGARDYRIPLDELRARWRGVRIESGAIDIDNVSRDL